MSAALTGAAITTLMGALVMGKELPVKERGVFLAGMAAAGALGGLALSRRSRPAYPARTP